MSVSTNDFKNGMTLELDGVLFQVVEFQHVKPGKGGAFVRTKLRNVKTGAMIERTFNAGVKVGLAIVERKGMQYLYSDGTDFVFHCRSLSRRRNRRQGSEKKEALYHSLLQDCLRILSGPAWIRTRDQRIMSPLL